MTIEEEKEVENLEHKVEDNNQESKEEIADTNKDEPEENESKQDQQASQPTEQELKEAEERKKAEEAFLERRRKKYQRQEQLESIPQQQRTQEQEDDLKDLREAAQQIKMQNLYSADKNAFTTLEKEYAENIATYNDEKQKAVNALKKRYITQGMSESDAASSVEYEMIVLANEAVRSGKDPVEEVHKKAQEINAWIASVAEDFGYAPVKKPKTNAQSLREAAKPNAMTSGLGRSGSATKYSFDDLDDPKDIADVPLSELMKKG